MTAVEEGHSLIQDYAVRNHRRKKIHTLIYYLTRFTGPFFLSTTILLFYWASTKYIALEYIQSASLFIKIIGYALLIFESLIIAIIFYSIYLIITSKSGYTEEVIKNPHFRQIVPNCVLDSIQKCKKCYLPKPPRCHHCKICNKCQLRMDHHCPALGVCISISNQQPFMVLLLWCTITSFIIGLLFLIKLNFGFYASKERVFSIIFASSGCIMSTLLFCFRFVTLYRIKKNITTIEYLFNMGTPFDMGIEENLRQIFGTKWHRHFFPTTHHLTGFEWCWPQFYNQAYLESLQ